MNKRYECKNGSDLFVRNKPQTTITMSHKLYLELPNGRKVEMPKRINPYNDLALNVLRNPNDPVAQEFKKFLMCIDLSDFDINKPPPGLQVIGAIPPGENSVALKLNGETKQKNGLMSPD